MESAGACSDVVVQHTRASDTWAHGLAWTVQSMSQAGWTVCICVQVELYLAWKSAQQCQALLRHGTA